MLPSIKRPREVAGFIGIKESTLANWRCAGRGPDYIKAGRNILYLTSSVNTWMEAQRVITGEKRQVGIPLQRQRRAGNKADQPRGYRRKQAAGTEARTETPGRNHAQGNASAASASTTVH